MKRMMTQLTVAAVLAPMTLAPLAGCQDLPGDAGTQGAVGGGAAGAVLGALLGGEDNRLIGALLGGAAGAGGGYLIGSQTGYLGGDDDDGEDLDRGEIRERAREANREAEESPATVTAARDAQTADLNGDGFVTLDEVVAMADAGLTRQQQIDRLRATGQVFELNASQERYLIRNGVHSDVVDAMEDIKPVPRRNASSLAAT